MRIDARQWVPLEFEATFTERTPESFAQVADLLGVESHKRYLPVGGKTFCNIYVWDFTKALGCEIPHWYDPSTGASVPMGKGLEMNANDMCFWLDVHGGKNGWHEGRGRVTVAGWYNKGGIGHVAMVWPALSADKATYISQAGRKNFRRAPLSKGFGAKNVLLWGHD